MTRRCAFAILLAACGAGPVDTPDATASEPFAAESGFIDDGPHHVFYALRSAQEDPAHRPVFVMWNGGPGFPTTLGLLHDTGPTAGADFTTLGSVLAIDQPLTGFSWCDATAHPFASPGSAGARSDAEGHRGDLIDTAFDMQRDAAVFARTIDAVLAAHPVLADAPVIVVGESYGGARAQLVLANETSARFVGQILIEPLVLGALQASLTPPATAACPYDTREGAESCLDLSAQAEDVAGRDVDLFGARLEDIPGLVVDGRRGVRSSQIALGGLAELETTLEARLGPLATGDAYFTTGPTSGDVFGDTSLVPSAFVANLARVHTFITHATFDQVIDTAVLPEALGQMGITASAHGDTIRVELPGGTSEIRWPTYAAGHQVAHDQGAQLRDDVAAWMSTW